MTARLFFKQPRSLSIHFSSCVIQASYPVKAILVTVLIMKLDAKAMRYFTAEDFRVLAAVCLFFRFVLPLIRRVEFKFDRFNKA